MSILVNNRPIQSFIFNGGECHISINGQNICETCKITAFLDNSNKVMSLLMTVDAVRQINPSTKIELEIPYFPYARQDRICNEGEAFSLAVMAKLINSLECEKVIVYDPHSKVTTQLLNRCTVITQADIFIHYLDRIDALKNNIKLVSPDAGAALKTKQVSEQMQIEVIYCSKTRETKTGVIRSTHIPINSKNGKSQIDKQSLMLIDDICDGGRTFLELAKGLKNAGAKHLYLYVTHGIFSQGLEALKEYFQHIYCYHSFLSTADIDKDFLTILKESSYEN